MKYALIGCGRISVNHIAAAQANKLDIVAISDILPEKMDEKNPICRDKKRKIGFLAFSN